MCRSLSERLGLHFLTVGRESRSTIRAIYEPIDHVRVYELHGDLMFAGAERVARIVDRDGDDFAVAFSTSPASTPSTTPPVPYSPE